jgi:hypothetical protein
LLTLQGGKQFLFNQVFISKFHPAHIVSRKKCICSGLLMLLEYIHVCMCTFSAVEVEVDYWKVQVYGTTYHTRM